MLLVVDIDGSIADISARMKVAGDEPARSDKKAYQQWVDKLQPVDGLALDRPIQPVQTMLRNLSFDHVDIMYVTGRSEKYRQVTERWLLEHRFPTGPLFMRANKDWRSARDYKGEVMARITKGYSDVLVIDDDPTLDCSPMYVENGWVHLKVLS